VKLAYTRRYLRALALYASTPRQSFIDVLPATYAQEQQPPTVLSFGQCFDAVPGLTRIEP
jgi:hypothetical protein